MFFFFFTPSWPAPLLYLSSAENWLHKDWKHVTHLFWAAQILYWIWLRCALQKYSPSLIYFVFCCMNTSNFKKYLNWRRSNTFDLNSDHFIFHKKSRPLKNVNESCIVQIKSTSYLNYLYHVTTLSCTNSKLFITPKTRSLLYPHWWQDYAVAIFTTSQA